MADPITPTSPAAARAVAARDGAGFVAWAAAGLRAAMALGAAALLLGASSSAMAQGAANNLRFNSVFPPGPDGTCPPTIRGLCGLEGVKAQLGRARADAPIGMQQPANVYFFAAGVYKGTLDIPPFPEREPIVFYGGFPAAGAPTGQTQQSFPGLVANRDLKNNVTVFSGDLNDNGIIDDGDAASVVTFTSRNANDVLDGFHIEGSTESAIKVVGRSPRLRNLVIRNNAGNGLHISGGATLSAANILIHGNGGTGAVVEDSAPSFIGLTVSGNGGSSTAVGGLSCTGSTGSCGSYLNTIIWGNAGDEVKLSSPDSVLPNPTFNYSLVQGCKVGGTWSAACGTEGSNTLADVDPLFVDAKPCAAVPNRLGDYRLQTGSPALDVGDNAATTRAKDADGASTTQLKDLDGLSRIQAGTIDLGPYEGGVVVPAFDGTCGTDGGTATATAPTHCSLCETGTATAVTGSDGAWRWSCNGRAGGAAASCSAPYAGQTITLNASPTSITVGGTASTVTGSSSSGAKPELTSSTTDTCSLSPTAGAPMVATGLASGLITGTCKVKATLAGTGDVGTFRYLAASEKAVDITVAKGSQAITGFAASPASIAIGGSSSLSATKGKGSAALVYSSKTTAICTVSGSTVTSVTGGVCTVAANQAGDANYTAAPEVTLNIAVQSSCKAFESRANVNIIDVSASPGGQTVRGVSGRFNVIYGSGFADTITGGNAGNCIDAGAGNDRLTAGNGENYLYGGEGIDTLTPGSGSTAMDGGPGTDKCLRASSRASATYASCESF